MLVGCVVLRRRRWWCTGWSGQRGVLSELDDEVQKSMCYVCSTRRPELKSELFLSRNPLYLRYLLLVSEIFFPTHLSFSASGLSLPRSASLDHLNWVARKMTKSMRQKVRREQQNGVDIVEAGTCDSCHWLNNLCPGLPIATHQSITNLQANFVRSLVAVIQVWDEGWRYQIKTLPPSIRPILMT